MHFCESSYEVFGTGHLGLPAGKKQLLCAAFAVVLRNCLMIQLELVGYSVLVILLILPN